MGKSIDQPNSKMKILYLTTTLSYSGAEQIILDLTRGNYQSMIAGLVLGDGELQKKAQNLGVPCFDLSMRSKMDWTIIKKIKNLVHDHQIDLIHTHLIHANVLGRWALRKLSIPVISTIHIIERRFRPHHRWLERATAQWVSQIIAVSPQVYEHAVNQLKLPIEKLQCISNGIDLDRFQPTQNKRDIDILFLGRLDQQKGFDRLITPLAKLFQKKPFELVVAGTGPEEESLKQIAQENSLPIKWIGFVPDPENWLTRAKLMVMPSRWEGFGLTLAEALACGCQVIYSGVDSLPFVAGPHGFQFPQEPDQWPSLIEKSLKSFKENPERRQWVKENFSRSKMIQAHQKLYEEILCAALPG